MQRLEMFLRNAIGKKYKLTASKLFNKKAATDDKEGGYFCSELVASAYKCLGLLPNNKEAS